MSFLFSDQLRFVKLLLTLLLIAGLVWWGAGEAMEREVTFVEAIERIDIYQGRKFEFAGRIINKENNLVTVRERGMEVLLSVNEVPGLAELPSGKVVSGRGVLNSEGRISVAEFHYHRYHEIKLWLSLIISVGIFVWFWGRFRFDIGKFIFEKSDL